MFSRHNERQSGDERLIRDDQRQGGFSALPSTGIRDAVAMPITHEPAVHPWPSRSSGRKTSFEGTLRVQRGLRVLGQIEGQIEAATSVTIEEGAKVEAGLTADEAIIAGEYSGKLVCRQRLEIRSTGRVKGEIETVRLMLHEGGFIDGALHMQKPAQPRRARGMARSRPRGVESLRAGGCRRARRRRPSWRRRPASRLDVASMLGGRRRGSSSGEVAPRPPW